MRRRAAALVALLGLTALSAPALAHAPPEGTGIFWPLGPTERPIVVRTNRGLLVSNDAGATFRLLCNEALGVATSETPALTFTSDGTALMATTSEGLLRESSGYCDWQPVDGPFSGVPAADVVTDPSRPNIHYLVTTPPEEPEGFYVTTDDGRTWTALGPSDVAFTRALVAPSDSSRLYRSGTRLDAAGELRRVVSVSRDGGATWTESVVPLQESELQLFLLAVDPTNPDRVYARAQASSEELPERLLVSTDGGATFATALSSPEIRALATTPDGSVVWAGSTEGLWRSNDGGTTFELVAGSGLSRLGCLAYRQNRLFACAVQDNRFGVSVSSDEGRSFTRFLDFSEVTEPVQCPTDSRGGATCEAPFSDWEREIVGTSTAADPSSPTAAPDAGNELATPGPTPPPSMDGSAKSSSPADGSGSASNDGSGCSVTRGTLAPAGSPGPSTWLWVMVVGGLMRGAARKRARR